MVDKTAENVTEAMSGKTFGRIRLGAASVGYMLLIFIVIYGLSDGVYEGFPGFVPYMIIVIFLAMAVVRMYQCILGRIPEKKTNERSWLFGRKDAADDEAGDEEDDEEDE